MGSLAQLLTIEGTSDFFMDDMNQYRRATFVAAETVERLRREGHPDAEAKGMVAEVINAEELGL
ncbi:MAG TPA: hypothetical protein VME24_01970 [Alphaproteobacteria bacterium]|nr:hypothetical protein [Alphaproteobacteria bacterium]